MLHIDTRYGTDNHFAYSRGNTLPYTGTPFGMNYFVPQSSHTDGAWFFNPNLPIFQGIRLTHQPSPWIGDFSWLLLTPFTGEIKPSDIFHHQSSYRPDESIFEPHYLKIHAERYQITTELVATRYGAKLRLSHKQHKQAIKLLLHSPAKMSWTQKDSYTLEGCLLEKTAYLKQELSMYIYLKCDQPIESFIQLKDNFCLYFADSQVDISLATSFLSKEQAILNLPRGDFEQILTSSEKEWCSYLDRLQVLDPGKEDQRMFNHACYRIFLFPQIFYEIDSDGQDWHRDLKSGALRKGKLFTNNGFWDTYRSNFPLYSLILADKYPDFLEGFLNSYRETGFLPKWLSPDERGMMPGTLIDGVIADSCVKDIAPDLQKELLEAMLATASKSDPDAHHGRHGVETYKQLGYLPADYHESVSHTLDYAYSDFCIATVAEKLGKKEIAQIYTKQAQNYRHLFDTDTGYMRAKDDKGHFIHPFSPYSWGKDTAECSAIQASLGVPHDLDGLKKLMGGEKAFTDYLLKLFNDQPSFETGGYDYEIHEMSEMASANFGQFAISNQPSFHFPYLFRESLRPEMTAYIIKTLRSQTFQPNFAAYPGDEDNGSMSAWYIFSCLGFYPMCPGKSSYALGIPLFPHIKIYLPQAKKWLHIKSQNHYPHFHFVKEAQLDGKVITELKHQELLNAEQLVFSLSWLPY